MDTFKRRKYAAPLGFVVILLAILGIAFVFVAISATYAKLTDNSEQILWFESYLTPVVMQDPPPFDDVSKASPDVLLHSAVWSTIIDYKNPDKTPLEDENGRTLLPISDIEVQCKKLFGDSVKLSFKTFGDEGEEFTYNTADKTYTVPITSYDPIRPDVISAKKSGGKTVLKVGYIMPGSEWTVDDKGKPVPPSPEKIMIYELEGKKRNYKIVSIKEYNEEK
jgi:hypothetical protein